MAREHLTLTIWNPAPVDKNPVTADGDTGGWAAGTYSFFVVAWYYNDIIEADKDNAGWETSFQANWNNVAVGDDETVHINWTQAARRPVWYSVYYQTAAVFNKGNIATKIAEIDGSLTSADIPDPSSLGTITLGAATTFNVSPVIQMDPIFRESGRSYDGTIMNPSYAPETAITELILTISTVSMTIAEYRRLMKCIERGFRIRILDPIGSGSEDKPFYNIYVGQFVSTDHLLSIQKNRRAELTLRFLVESVQVYATV